MVSHAKCGAQAQMSAGLIDSEALLAECERCPSRPFAICSAVTGDDLAAIASAKHKVRYERGETIFDEGEPIEHVYSQTSGSAKLFKLLPDGRRQIIGFTLPGDLLFYPPPPNSNHEFAAEAITEVAACRFPAGGFKTMLTEVPGLMDRLLDMTAHELSAAQDQMLLLGRKTARERIASFLVGLLKRHDRFVGARVASMDIPMSRSDIGDYLGLTTETVSRVLTRFKQEGLIQSTGGKQLRAQDREKLEAIAGGEV